MGMVVAIAGIVGFTSCENKNEKQDKNKRPNTETPVSAFSYNYKAEKRNAKNGDECKVYHRQDTYSSNVQNGNTEYKFYSKEQISQKQSMQEKKESPKKRNNDALTNLAVYKKCGGRNNGKD